MMPTRMRRGPPVGSTPRCDRGTNPDGRSVADPTIDPSPALTGATSLSREDGSDGSPKPEGPSSWSDDYTRRLHSHATATSVVADRLHGKSVGAGRAAGPDPRHEVRHPPAQEVQAAAKAIAGRGQQGLRPGHGQREDPAERGRAEEECDEGQGQRDAAEDLGEPR